MLLGGGKGEGRGCSLGGSSRAAAEKGVSRWGDRLPRGCTRPTDRVTGSHRTRTYTPFPVERRRFVIYSMNSLSCLPLIKCGLLDTTRFRAGMADFAITARREETKTSFVPLRDQCIFKGDFPLRDVYRTRASKTQRWSFGRIRTKTKRMKSFYIHGTPVFPCLRGIPL